MPFKFVTLSNLTFNSSLNKFIFFTSISVLFFLSSFNVGMFWDNILFASKVGNHLYLNNIFDWTIPDILDSGHPPILGFLLAVFWKILGRELWVSHLLMLPFTYGLLYQIFRFIHFYTKSNYISFFGFLLVIADPTLSAQFILVNPEIIQLFLFFLAINSILFKKNHHKVIALLFLSIISIRSMMLCGGIFIFEILNGIFIQKKRIISFLNIKFITSYLIGSTFGISYLIMHYFKKGWFVSHPNSPWVNHHQIISFDGFLKNILSLAHRYSDYGRLFLILFILYSLFIFKEKIFTKNTKQLLLLSFSSVIIIIMISIFSTNPFGHRYFIVSYISLNFLAYSIIVDFFKHKRAIYTFLFLILITGNLWIYPRNISQGWDASLAHLPYFKLRDKAILWLDQEKIQIDKTATFFPNATSIDNIVLNNDFRKFENYNSINEYIFYSNVYNLSDEIYENLDSNYSVIKKFEKFRIHIYIYKRNNNETTRRKINLQPD